MDALTREGVAYTAADDLQALCERLPSGEIEGYKKLAKEMAMKAMMPPAAEDEWSTTPPEAVTE